LGDQRNPGIPRISWRNFYFAIGPSGAGMTFGAYLRGPV